MINQHIIENKDLPENFKCQVLSFLRVNSPDGFKGQNRLRDWITDPKIHPIGFILEENGILISYLEVVWKYLYHAGETYKAYGLTGVLTYPAFRREGNGLRLLKVAKDYILEKKDADVVIFHSKLRGYYENAGFELMEKVVTLIGNPKNPTKKTDEKPFMLFISDKGKKGRESFETIPLYFGEDTW